MDTKIPCKFYSDTEISKQNIAPHMIIFGNGASFSYDGQQTTFYALNGTGHLIQHCHQRTRAL